MQTAVLTIDGMEGEGCADRIAQLLTNIDGVSDVRVSLRDGLASVQLDESLVSPHMLMRGLTAAGYPAVAAGEAARKPGTCCGGCCGG
ncbi:copper chaperone [Duganella sp. FT109W]|uniref:Copper chaperone n=1 Tax=Duganella margarita TaxID=2692170 RepID=A0A7X4KGE9_9BURK|nr:heavy-metal-associated domain-containing protein [Duganella margarita]MYM72355.1 copper chaperone [Duganella margarita]MYN39943.1 copper chaperone [Duganella margarita]